MIYNFSENSDSSHPLSSELNQNSRQRNKNPTKYTLPVVLYTPLHPDISGLFFSVYLN